MVAVVGCTDDARAIYRDAEATKPPAVYGPINVFAGHENIVSVDGAAWLHRRKAINPAFAPKHIKRMNQVAVQAAEQWIAAKLEQMEGNQVTFDVGKEMVETTMSVICKAAFDYDIDDEERQLVLQEIKLAFAEFTMKTVVNPLRFLATRFLPERQRAFVALEEMQAFARRVMENYRNKATTPTPDTVIDMIMSNPNYNNDKERAADIIVILFAGHDTTGYTLALALRLLAQNPSEQEKLRGELSKGSSPEPAAGTTSYLKAVITETMRMHPVAPVTGYRSLSKDYVTTSGFMLPKGTVVFQALIAVTRDSSIFENPFEFCPSRWLNPSEQAARALFPFALGKRNCVGQPLSNAELYTVLPMLIRKFKFSVNQEGEIITPGSLRLDNCWLTCSTVEESN